MTIPTLVSHDGVELPAIGFGTYQLNGVAGADAIAEAVSNGYRLLDSAFRYENEGAVGAAVRRTPERRDEIIVTSKLPGALHDYDGALFTIEESLYRTGLDQLDLYLIHWPNPAEDRYVDAWRGLIEARSRGLVTAIGVCNFLPEHLLRLADETGVMPSVNQIEMHPWFPQVEQRAFHETHGILTEAWAPLGRGTSMLGDPVITDVAAAHSVTPAQAVLRWHVQNGAIPLPKAASSARQRENLDVFGFELTDDELAALAALARPDGRSSNQDPAVHQEF